MASCGDSSSESHLKHIFATVLHLLQASCGADGKIIIWDVSGDEPKEVEVVQGTLPTVSDPEYVTRRSSGSFRLNPRFSSPEWQHDCTAIWHTSGEYFFIATRTHGKYSHMNSHDAD